MALKDGGILLFRTDILFFDEFCYPLYLLYLFPFIFQSTASVSLVRLVTIQDVWRCGRSVWEVVCVGKVGMTGMLLSCAGHRDSQQALHMLTSSKRTNSIHCFLPKYYLWLLEYDSCLVSLSIETYISCSLKNIFACQERWSI